MKRTFRFGAHLVELKREIPAMQISQEKKLSGGFLGVPGVYSEEVINNNNFFEGCVCNNVSGCGSNPTPTATATATRTAIVIIPLL